MQGSINLTADCVYIALDIDGVLHSMFTDCQPAWKEHLRAGVWTPAMFHAAVREAFLEALQDELNSGSPDDSFKDGYLFSQTPLLEAVLRRHTAARIVIASDWRLSLPLPLLRSLLPPAVAQRVVGATASVREKDSAGHPVPGIRGKLMREWLRTNQLPNDTPWVAIDDCAVLWRGDESSLIHTFFAEGLQPADVRKLDDWLAATAPSRGTSVNQHLPRCGRAQAVFAVQA